MNDFATRLVRVVLPLSVLCLSPACTTTPEAVERIIVSDGAWTFDSADATLTQHNCHKPEETVKASLPARRIRTVVHLADKADFFEYSGPLASQAEMAEAMQLKRICVNSYSPPHRIAIETETRSSEVTWQRCSIHDDDEIGEFLHDTPSRVFEWLDVDRETVFSNYDCGWY